MPRRSCCKNRFNLPLNSTFRNIAHRHQGYSKKSAVGKNVQFLTQGREIVRLYLGIRGEVEPDAITHVAFDVPGAVGTRR